MQTLKKISSITAIGAVMGLASLASHVSAADLSAVPTGSYTVDPTHAYVNFQYSHLGLSNPTLSFDDFTVDLILDNADPTQSTVSVSIDTDSILTGSDVFKEHLSSADWFDFAEYPKATFDSTSIEATGDSTYAVTGDLTIKDVTKPLTLNVSINAAMEHPMNKKPVVGLDATGSLLRSDFGLGKFAPYVGDEIALNISVEMFKTE